MLDFSVETIKEEKKETQKKEVKARVFQRTTKTQTRRAFSEVTLRELLPHNLEKGQSYHVISGGDVDSLSFLKHILYEQNLDYCLFSTWCMASEDVALFGEWIEQGKIKRLDCYVGEIFPNSYSAQFNELKKIIDKTDGRICVFRNHAKLYAGFGEKFDFAIESSANINTNPRTEQTTITVCSELAKFYKSFYDDIKSFDRSYEDWRSYNA